MAVVSIIMKNKIILFAVVILLAAFNSLSRAQPFYLAGSFNGWNASSPDYEMSPASPGYVYIITNGTPGAFHDFKVATLNFGSSYPPGNARGKFNAGGTNIIHFYPGSTIDGWLPLSDRVGYEDPGNVSWEVAGDFNGWSGGPGNQLNSVGNGLYSNSIVIPTAGSHDCKFRSSGTWNDLIIGTTFENGGNNITFSTTNSPQTVKFQLDLSKGRWVVGDLAPAPVTNQVVFAVDMSTQRLLGAFDPATDTAYVSGAFNGWPGTGGGALVLTNYPPYNGGSNTNIYYATNIFIGLPNTFASDYKFTDNNPALSGQSGYEPRPTNRGLFLLATNGVLILPVVSFGDVLSSDFLTVDTLVTFSLNMSNAQSISRTVVDPGVSTNVYPPVAFDGSQTVYINGDFLDNGWGNPWTPIHLVQMTENPLGSFIYTYTHLVKAGHQLQMHYKYSFDDNGPLDDEAPAFQDHSRFIRITATGSYTNALDTFGNQYVEPSFGKLSVSPASPGMVQLKWLGRPGVYVQTSTNLAGASWVNHQETDGTNWTAGIMSTNGFLSVSNWPAAGGNQFFRLVKP